jgi:phage gp16-like protein
MEPEKNTPLLVCIGISALGLVLFANFAVWFGLSISVNSQTVANILAPLLLTAGFIERAVEVVITPWRDPGYTQRQAELTTVNASATATPEEKKKASDALNAYVGKTTQYAFTVATMFGLVAAMVGIRALWPFLNQNAISYFGTAPAAAQKNTFVVFDVVLSAALVAGGANGVHSVITAFTSFFDASAQKSQNSSKS